MFVSLTSLLYGPCIEPLMPPLLFILFIYFDNYDLFLYSDSALAARTRGS